MSATGKRVLLVGWSGAESRILQPLIDRGELPALEKLITSGVMGDLSTLSPMVGPSLWTSIATGTRPFDHGIHGSIEPCPETGDVRPTSLAYSGFAPVWELLSQAGLRSHVIGWPVSHPAENQGGTCVSDAFPQFEQRGEIDALVQGSAVFPARLAPVLRELRVAPAEIDSDVLRLFVPRLAEIDRSRDGRVNQLAAHIAEAASIQAASTWLLAHEPWDFAAVHFPTLQRIGDDFIGFQSPKYAEVPQRLADLYGEVLPSAYRLLDLMLQRLLALAGSETVVLLVSEHGYIHGTARAEAGRDRNAEWRPMGMLVMSGPGIRGDGLVFGGHLLQIAPTVLAVLGQSVPAHLEPVLHAAFVEGTPAPAIRSEDISAGAARTHLEAGSRLPPHASQPVSAAYARVRLEYQWNLAQAYLDADRQADALPLLEMVHAIQPERTDIAEALVRCQVQLGLFERAEETLETILDAAGDAPLARLLLGNLAFARHEYAESLAHLRAAERDDPHLHGLHNQVGLTLTRLGEWEEAQSAFRRTLADHPDEPFALLGLAYSALRQGRFSEAAECALNSIGQRYHIPLTHFILGMALSRLGDPGRAVHAFENAVSLAPGFSQAHRILARIYARMPGQAQKAETHLLAARESAATSSSIRQWRRPIAEA
jgi:tetratricopeptide (TPR) repeat protein